MEAIKTNRMSIIFLIFVALLNASCTTMRPITTTALQDQSHGLNVGDKVQVNTRQGESHQFKIVQITDDALYGEDIRISFEDIENIDRKEYSKEKTIGLAAGSYIAIMALFAALLFSLSDDVLDSVFSD